MNKQIIFLGILIFAIFVMIVRGLSADKKSNVTNKIPERPVVTTTLKSNDILEFTLTAGEIGEYGGYTTLNKGTDGELTRLVYNVPSGTYTVTNIGEYRAQINVYSNATHYTEEGWEEPDFGKSQLIEAGESATVYVYNDYYVYISSPDKLKMKLISEAVPEAPSN